MNPQASRACDSVTEAINAVVQMNDENLSRDIVPVLDQIRTRLMRRALGDDRVIKLEGSDVGTGGSPPGARAS